MASDNNTSWEILFAFQKRYRSDHKLTGTAFLRQLELPGTLLPYLYSECRQPSKKASPLSSCSSSASTYHDQFFLIFLLLVGQVRVLQVRKHKIVAGIAHDGCLQCTQVKMYSKIFNKIRVEIFHGERKEIEPHLFFFQVIYESQAWCVTERKLSETIQR